MNYPNIRGSTRIVYIKSCVKSVTLPVLRDDCVKVSVNDWVVPFHLDRPRTFDLIEIKIEKFDFLGKEIGLGYDPEVNVLVIAGVIQ